MKRTGDSSGQALERSRGSLTTKARVGVNHREGEIVRMFECPGGMSEKGKTRIGF